MTILKLACLTQDLLLGQHCCLDLSSPGLARSSGLAKWSGLARRSVLARRCCDLATSVLPPTLPLSGQLLLEVTSTLLY